ncbi:MAG: arylamine N-acetyltransferase [Actinobacteria bacterium]|nr:arylamine N-acetyltransferase [Actinomycetota bacterium]
MNLQGYLDRVGFEGIPRPDLETLRDLHRGHVTSIPFENLDVLLGRTVDFDLERIFDKVVDRRRGGWCYEMNGLLGWALETIGFDVTRLAGGVGRSQRGESAVGNHLLLLVNEAWLADVGFGNGLREPVKLEVGEILQDGFRSRLDVVEDGWWRYQNQSGEEFDFRVEPADQKLLQDRCDYLRTSPDSGLRRNLVALIHTADRREGLRNSIHTVEHPDRVERSVLHSEEEMVNLLGEVFGILDPELGSLWPEARVQGEAHLLDGEVGGLGREGPDQV